jgi:hypothetical protein
MPTNVLHDLLKHAVLTAEVRMHLTIELDERAKRAQPTSPA